MSEADCHRALAQAFDDITMHRNLLALLPFTVHVDHELERATARATRLLNRIPAPRPPSEPFPRPVRRSMIREIQLPVRRAR